MGGPAHPGRLMRGELHPRLELSAGARQPFPGSRANAPRNGVHLQSVAERRPDLPPEATAWFRLRYHRSMCRRTLWRDRQSISGVEKPRRRRVAETLLAEHQARYRVRLV